MTILARTGRMAAARLWSRALHVDQQRFDGETYFHHTWRVADLVQRAGGSEKTVIAATLHDAVEDGKTTLYDIEHRFGPEVARLVDDVTRRRGDQYEPDETYTQFIERVIDAGPEACSIKRADLIDNLSTLPFGHRLWDRYMDALGRIQISMASWARAQEGVARRGG